MYGELTDKETVSRLEYTLESQQQDQFEILLYKKNSKFFRICRLGPLKNISWAIKGFCELKSKYDNL